VVAADLPPVEPPCHPASWTRIPGVGTGPGCPPNDLRGTELILAGWSPLTDPAGPAHLADKPFVGGSIAPVHSGLKENA